jgi:hypothetical protein
LTASASTSAGRSGASRVAGPSGFSGAPSRLRLRVELDRAGVGPLDVDPRADLLELAVQVALNLVRSLKLAAGAVHPADLPGEQPKLAADEQPANRAVRTPACERGEWTFAGADFKRRATKWRCPTGECQPSSVWVKTDRLHPLIPRTTERSRKLCCSRGAVEREFGRLKREWAMLPLRVRGLDRVRLHADLTILAKLTIALARARARAVPLAA